MTPHAAELDVAIVGAGPSGGAAALELAGRGLRVAILERAMPPRHKTCGGGVLRRARQRLPVEISAAVQHECHLAEMVHHTAGVRFTCTRAEPIVSMVMRDEFDHLLVRAAVAGGVELRSGLNVTGVEAGAESVRLQTAAGEVRARFVIAADGVSSVVARKTGRPPLDGLMPALECEVTLPEEAMDAFRRSARFDFGVVPAGYGWVFPKRDHLSIGVATRHRVGANLAECYRRYLDALGIGEPLHEVRHGYVIPCRPRRDLFGVPRVLLVGDAAGLADPVTAEGITAAIVSGQLAARAILAGAGPDSAPAVARSYRTTLEQQWLAEMRVARGLARGLYEFPRCTAACFRWRGRPLAEAMTDLVTGGASYRGLVYRPINYIRLLLGRRKRTALGGSSPPGQGGGCIQ